MFLKQMARLRFSTRTLLLLVAAVALALGWLISNQRLAKTEAKAILEIQANYAGFRATDRSTPFLRGTGLSGIVDRNPTSPLHRILGATWPDTFYHVTSVSITGLRYDDRVLEHVGKFRELKSLTVKRTSITESRLMDFRNKYPHIEISVTEPTFAMTDEDDPAQILESINHW